jgi:hypothetical protein
VRAAGGPGRAAVAADLAAQAAEEGLVESVARSTVQRWLDADAIRPWRYRSWIFPRYAQLRIAGAMSSSGLCGADREAPAALAEPARGLAADLPAPGGGRAGLRQPRRDRLRHPGGHRPTQRPRPALEAAQAQITLLPPPLCVQPLRNVALGLYLWIRTALSRQACRAGSQMRSCQVLR